jgi:UDP-N-acetylglucosamine 2-epimerase (non-hydrolysing)
MIDLFDKLSHSYKIIFPIHPRTVGNLKNFGLQDKLLLNSNIICCEPLGYFDFQNLISNCKFIITDSGGIQEESTFLLKPCLTLRANTERPVTCIEGTNTLVPFDIDEIMKLVKEIEIGEYKKGKIPFKWDGYSTERIFEALETLV